MISGFSLSPLQRWLWDVERRSGTCRAQCVVRLRGHLDRERLRAALTLTGRRHEILRTGFPSVAGVQYPLQRIDEAAPVFEPADLPVEEICRRERELPFDLDGGPLWRNVLAARGESEHVLVITLPSLCADAATFDRLVAEVAAFYEGTGPSGEPLQYADLAEWQAEILRSEEGAAAREHWARQAGSTAAAPPLPHACLEREPLPRRCARFEWPAELAARVEAMDDPEAFLAACWQALRLRLAGVPDLVAAHRLDGRALEDLAPALGPLARPLPLRARWEPEAPFSSLLDRVAAELAEGAACQHACPFGEELLEETCFEARRRPAPVAAAGVLFAVERRFVDSGLGADLVCEIAPGELISELVYDPAFLGEAAASRLLRQLATLAETAAGAPRTPVGRLPILPQEERRRILASFQGPSEPQAEPALLHRRIEAQAARTPDAPALAGSGGATTFGELNRRANRIARWLLGQGVGPEDRIAIALDRSPDAVAASLAVLKAGAAFVALDLAHPDERLESLAAQAGVSLLVSSGRWQERVSGWAPRALWLDREASFAERAGDPRVPVDPDQAAYVAFTSGSTGRPKGVIATHRGVANYLEYLRRYGWGPGSRMLQLASSSVDASVRDLFAPLAFGATVVLPTPAEAKLPRALLECVRRHGVTDVPALVPSLLRSLAEVRTDEPGPVRRVLLSGERLHGADAVLARRIFGPGIELVNQYGPTEATMTSTWHRVPDPAGEPLPVGRPIPNARLYVLDRGLEPVPTGVAGEVFLGGPGLARGYLGRPGATAAAFVPDPFGEPGGRLYRTGDLARYAEDGTVELLGRADHQLKVRGHRVEPGEVEAALAGHPQVREAAVVPREDGAGGSLAAHVVPLPGHAPAPGELRAFLARKLPPFLVPGSFVLHPALPRTPNGKVDRRALAAAEAGRPRPGAGAAPPAAGLEETLASLWREVLQVDRVGVHDNFFDLGGHSLLLVRLHARIEEALGRELSLVELFQYPTVRALAEHLSPPSPAAAPRPRPAPRRAAPGGGAVAVVGMAGRFPGAADVDELWRNLRDGVESISTFTVEEAAAEGVDPALLAHSRYVRAGGVLQGAELFDAELFGFTPREAELLDPQHRHFLECAYAALEDAGCDPGRFPGAVGVFGGTTFSSYLRHHLVSNAGLIAALGEFQVGLGAHKDFLTTRVSYKLGLQGPSLDVQTACSTSLVAVAMACQSLLAGQCDLALAGGAAIKLPQRSGYLYQEGGQESSDGRCRAFDARADGAVFGNGAGVVALKRLEDALADGDPIRAVILGSAVNNDGSAKVGYTAPSVEGQARVIAAAQAQAGIAPETVSYVEAHGTGTALGDPIEVAALARAFGTAGGRRCALGSIKPNIGHLSAAAGVSGLIKAVLALEHRQIPPSLHFETPNPRIDFEKSPFYVNDRLADWPAEGTPRRAGVSSFGIGGTNAHVVLEEAPRPEPSGPSSRPWQLLTLSARSPEAVEALTDRLAADFAARPDLDPADAAHTLHLGRRQLEHRRILVCRDLADARAALAERHPRRVLSAHQPPGRRSLAMLFPGLGDHYEGMGRGLYETEPVFRREIDRAAEVLHPVLGCDLREALYPAGRAAGNGRGEIDLRRLIRGGGDADRLGRPSLSQPALFAVEHALARLWMEWGLVPEAVAGYSLGEYVAACVAGVFSFEDALLLVARRALLIEDLPPGAMMAVPLPPGEAEALLGSELEIAAVNGPTLSVVAGPERAVAELGERLDAEGTPWRRLPVSHAYHTRAMMPAAGLLAGLVSALAPCAPRIPMLSNVTGTWLTPDEATDPGYWARHLCGTVRFSAILHELWRTRSRVVLEVGPGQGLASLALQHAGSPGRVAVPSLRGAAESQPDAAYLLTALGRLWLAGLEVDWQRFHAGERRRKVRLPTYPFARRRYWIEPARDTAAAPAVEERDRLWAPVWKRSAPRSGDRAAGGPLAWLLFAEGEGPGAELAELLRRRGERVVTVKPGEDFARTGEASFAVRADRSEDYSALLDEIGGLDGTRIVHLWTVDPEGSPGLDGLTALAGALAGRGGAAADVRVVSSRLWAVTGEERLVPERAALLGCGRLGWPMVDVEVPAAPGRRAALLEALAAELSRPAADRSVAYRGGRRWVCSFEPLPPLPPDAGALRLEPEGAYLLLCDDAVLLGELAWAFASRAAAKLVLAGPVDGSLRRTLKNLGAQVRTIPVTDCSSDFLKVMVERAVARTGPLRGVVCAVEGGDRVPLDATAGQVRRLAAALEGSRPDFLFLLGEAPPAEADPVRAAARAALLDAFAWQGSSEGSPWTSVVCHRAPGPERSAAVEAVMRALSSEPTPQLALSRRSPDLPPEAGAADNGLAAQGHARPRTANRYTPPRDERERTLVRIWQDLLGIDQVGIHDSFFELGGHSLQGTVLLSRLRDILQVELPLVALFEGPTVAELAAAVAEALRSAAAATAPPLVPVPREGELPLSFAQERLWFLNYLESDDGHPAERVHLGTRRFRTTTEVGSGARGVLLRGEEERSLAQAVYNLAFAVRLAGPLDISVLARSFQALVDRHETLRTGFGEIHGRPLLLIDPDLRFPLPVVDLAALPGERREALALELAHQIQRQPFELARPSLLRALVVRLEPGVHALLLTIHHIVSDGWSTAVLVHELIALYEAFLEGRPSPLPGLPVQYVDYAAWQKRILSRTALDGQLRYWRERLAGVPSLELPADRPRPPVQSYRGGTFRLDTPRELARAVQAVAVEEKVSLFMFLSAAFSALMVRIAGQQDVVLGTPVANRTRSELEGLIGPFVNLLVMRTDASGDPGFRELLGRTREVALGAYAHQDLPFEQLIQELQPRRDLSRSPLFQVMVNMLAGPDPKLQFGGLSLSQMGTEVGSTLFDLSLYLSESPYGLRQVWEYSSDLFDAATVEHLARQLQTVLATVAADPDRRISELPLLTRTQEQQVLYRRLLGRAGEQEDEEIPESQPMAPRDDPSAALSRD